MKVFVFADMHGDMKVFSNLKNKAVNADILVCAGDISRMENNLKNILVQLNDFGKPVLMIHGNHEDERGLKDLCDSLNNIIFLHKAVHHVGPIVFLGYGGDGFSVKDPEFTLVANSFFRKEIQGKEKIILITHGPPYDSVIDVINGDLRGNQSYREFIDDIKPHLVIAGHLHENAGKHHKIGRTVFLNPGAGGVIVNI